MELLEQLIQQTCGNDYNISPHKFLRKATVKKVSGQTKEGKELVVNEGRAFFCSELQAKAYKLMGVIEDDNTSSTQFFPGTFTSKHDSFLKLKPGVSIEGEQLVIVHREDLESELQNKLPDD